MNHRKKAVFNWSGGKDSALALQKTLQDNEFDVISLLTTIDQESLTSSIHAIPLEVLSRQAQSIGIPLHSVLFAKDLTNYDDKMRETVEHFKAHGVTHFIFGDIFLADIKAYRESKLHPLGIEVVEPLWDKSSAEIIHEFLHSGIKTKIIVTQADLLDESFIGKELDLNTIHQFPDSIDVCGENGEYHTLSYAGGPFKTEIDFSILQTKKITYDIRLDTGELKTFEYWQADVVE